LGLVSLSTVEEEAEIALTDPLASDIFVDSLMDHDDDKKMHRSFLSKVFFRDDRAEVPPTTDVGGVSSIFTEDSDDKKEIVKNSKYFWWIS
jgi:hypothetical protein